MDVLFLYDLTMEADQLFVNMPDDFLPTGAAFLHDIGRQLIQMINTDSND